MTTFKMYPFAASVSLVWGRCLPSHAWRDACGASPRGLAPFRSRGTVRSVLLLLGLLV